MFPRAPPYGAMVLSESEGISLQTSPWKRFKTGRESGTFLKLGRDAPGLSRQKGWKERRVGWVPERGS